MRAHPLLGERWPLVMAAGHAPPVAEELTAGTLRLLVALKAAPVVGVTVSCVVIEVVEYSAVDVGTAFTVCVMAVDPVAVLGSV